LEVELQFPMWNCFIPSLEHSEEGVIYFLEVLSLINALNNVDV
jgi:hypothetical protein